MQLTRRCNFVALLLAKTADAAIAAIAAIAFRFRRRHRGGATALGKAAVPISESAAAGSRPRDASVQQSRAHVTHDTKPQVTWTLKEIGLGCAEASDKASGPPWPRKARTARTERTISPEGRARGSMPTGHKGDEAEPSRKPWEE